MIPVEVIHRYQHSGLHCDICLLCADVETEILAQAGTEGLKILR